MSTSPELRDRHKPALQSASSLARCDLVSQRQLRTFNHDPDVACIFIWASNYPCLPPLAHEGDAAGLDISGVDRCLLVVVADTGQRGEEIGPVAKQLLIKPGVKRHRSSGATPPQPRPLTPATSTSTLNPQVRARRRLARSGAPARRRAAVWVRIGGQWRKGRIIEWVTEQDATGWECVILADDPRRRALARPLRPRSSGHPAPGQQHPARRARLTPPSGPVARPARSPAAAAGPLRPPPGRAPAAPRTGPAAPRRADRGPHRGHAGRGCTPAGLTDTLRIGAGRRRSGASASRPPAASAWR